MSNISQIQIDNTTYDIADATVRNFVKEDGSIIINGNLAVGNNTYDQGQINGAMNCRTNSAAEIWSDSYSEAARCFSVNCDVKNDAATYNNRRASLFVMTTGLNLYIPASEGNAAVDPWKLKLPAGTTDLNVTSTSTISQIITAGSGITINKADYAQWGKLAMVYIGAKTTAAKSGTFTVGTLVAGKRPKIESGGDTGSNSSVCYLTTDGVLHFVSGNIAANSVIYCKLTYLLA